MKLLINENFPFRSNTSTALTLYRPLVVKFFFVSGAKWYDINGTCLLIVMLIHLFFPCWGEKNISYVFVHLQLKYAKKKPVYFHTKTLCYLDLLNFSLQNKISSFSFTTRIRKFFIWLGGGESSLQILIEIIHGRLIVAFKWSDKWLLLRWISAVLNRCGPWKLTFVLI